MTEHERVAYLMEQPNAIFVFGSNLAGRHGRGAALDAAKKYGAVYGKGHGIAGRSYAIPTKDAELRPLPLETVRVYVDKFLTVAQSSPTLTFVVTRVGCGLARQKESDMCVMFQSAPPNCELPEGWR